MHTFLLHFDLLVSRKSSIYLKLKILLNYRKKKLIDDYISFAATLKFENRELPVLMGGPLHEDHYAFEQLHFHWSEDDHSGCEHIFEGRT